MFTRQRIRAWAAAVALLPGCGKDNPAAPPGGLPVLEFAGSALWRALDDVAVRGDYAYCAHAFGLRILNIADPSAISFVARLDLPSREFGHIALEGNAAYLLGAPGLQIVDVTDPEHPAPLGACSTAGEDIAVAGSHAYVTDGSLNLRVVDVSATSAPHEVGGLNLAGPASGIALRIPYAFVAAGSAGLYVLDITTPGSPTIAAELHTPENAVDVSLSGDLAYVVGGDSLLVVDISAPRVPRRLGAALEARGIREIDVSGSLGFAVMGGSGTGQFAVLGLDLSVPERPQWGASLGPFGDVRALRIASTRLLVAEHETGLHIFDASNPQVPAPLGRSGQRFGIVDVALTGTHAVLACGQAGVRVVDISPPEIGPPFPSYDTPGSAQRVAVSGDLVFVADSLSLQILTIADPLAPTFVGMHPTGGVARGVRVDGALAYVAADAAGLEIYDVSDPAAPIRLSTYHTAGPAYDVALLGHYACIDGSEIVDVTRPEAPVHVTGTSAGGTRLAVSGNLLYVAGGLFVILEVSDPRHPGLLYLGGLAGESRDVAASGSRACLAWDLVEYGGSGGVTLLDMSNPRAPNGVSGWTTPGHPAGIAMDGNRVYVADAYGFVVLEIHER